jgi:D-3-phosphoglycerate dehydrogenase
MNQVLLLYGSLPGEAVELLKREAQIVGPFGPQDDWRVPLKEADALITSAQFKFTPEVLDSAPRLRAIGRAGIGVDNIDLAAATERGICVVNTPDAPTEPVAEKAVGWMLMLSHRLREADRVARGAGWQERASLLGHDLAGKTLGVIGIGRVGGRVAHICSAALSMRVLASDPHTNPARAHLLGLEPVPSLDELLPAADFVSLHCPLTDETRGMLGERELRMMKPTAYLVNAARAQIVREEALLRALREGWIAGAAIDVFPSEPPPPDYPLLALDNVILSPHFASLTHEGVMRISMGSAEQVLMVLRGERPPNLVNPEVWEKRR